MPSDLTVTTGDASFEQDVIASETPVLVDFWAPWCGPCRMVAPILDELAAEKDGALTIAKVNVDENQGLAARYDVLSIPTIMLFKNGEMAKKWVGAMPKRRLENDLAEYGV